MAAEAGGNHEQFGITERDLLDIVSYYDGERRELMGLLKEMAEGPGEPDIVVGLIDTHAALVVRSWRDVLVSLGQDNGCRSEEFITSVATLWFDDDSERVGSLNRLTNTEICHPVAGGDVWTLEQEILDYVERLEYECGHVATEDELDAQVVSTLVGDYRAYMEDDISRYLEALWASPPQQGEGI